MDKRLAEAVAHVNIEKGNQPSRNKEFPSKPEVASKARGNTMSETILKLLILLLALASQAEANLLPVSSKNLKAIKQEVADQASKLACPSSPKEAAKNQHERMDLAPEDLTPGLRVKRVFVSELLKILYEQYSKTLPAGKLKVAAARDDSAASMSKQLMMSQLLGAISANGDLPRLIDWVQNSFNMASMSELMTQFVISKLGSVNCAALLKPTDDEATLMPRFLLFNEYFSDVPFELPPNPSASECMSLAKFDPLRKTMILIHGYLAGYTLVDGLTNIKNRLLDLNRFIEEGAMRAFHETAMSNGTYVLAEDLHLKIRQQQYNVIMVDWFNGANPVPRASYIKAAVNAPVVGRLIARFLTSLVLNCRTQSSQLQILAHSLGCHVAGFTGKSMNAAGLRMAKIIHLDPVGLCFGRLFSEPHFRLSPDDAYETHAVHVSLNLFDNPLDGTHNNFLVNGGRDQPGCTGQSELQNSTSSSVSLLFDSEAKFSPCSHLRALALFEDDHSSRPGECQMVGYRCQNYETFLAGRCGRCDQHNSQCRLMSLPSVQMRFRRVVIPKAVSRAEKVEDSKAKTANDTSSNLMNLMNEVSNSSISWLVNDHELNQKIGSTIAKLRPEMIALEKADQLKQSVEQTSGSDTPETGNASPGETQPGDAYIDRLDEQAADESSGPLDTSEDDLESGSLEPDQQPDRRVDKMLMADSSLDPHERLLSPFDKLRSDTKHLLLDGWTNLKSADQRPRLVGLQMRPRLPLPTVLSVPAGALEHGYELGVETVELEDPYAAAAVNEAAAWDQHAPLGSQKIPMGAINTPMYFLGTGAITPYCVNYYQLRILIAESRINKLLANNQLARSQMKFLSANELLGASVASAATVAAGPLQQHQQFRAHPAIPTRDMLHLTVKLLDSAGHFFKGFTMSENARTMVRIPILSARQRALSASENMLELTMLLNSTRPQPVKVSEMIISYYFHSVVMADLVEVNYMSNISPE